MTKRKIRKTHLMAIILATLLLLPLAIPALASSLSAEDEQKALTGADVLYEDLTKREKFAKHYVTGEDRILRFRMQNRNTAHFYMNLVMRYF